ncbi:epoxide hydrolase family protein [Amycolatopsis sp. YIM 10]|uniref:epoxide hydrolase family protein n=1 Tax=Amycolatopsis sp. YIM 10 TaxID=2653857 RepID=UPI00128FF7CD|nr:epoxide hydrolase family protein [Amycolatopsis sp. YIM 10]QFU90083.1 haloalkane dehalogenase [Amycolatopsis sp. YIM 10]
MTDEAATETRIHPFRIDVPEVALDDLRARLAAAHWPDQLPGAGWTYGVPLERLKELAGYWRTGYDWRRHERALNRFPQFTTTIDGQHVHFFHVRSPEPEAVPLLLTHGWPASGAEFAELIGPLTDPRAHGGDPADAFHVVVPSIPGYGFSGPTTEAGWGVTRIARAWAELMRRLGYHRYGAQGGDWGARVSPELARLDGDRMIGLHLNAFIAFPDDNLDGLTESELAIVDALNNWSGERSGYAQIQGTRPQTLAYGLVDSPTGLLAWDTEWFDAYGDDVGGIEADRILTTVTITWLTGTAGSSARLYREGAANWEQEIAFSPVPTGIAVFPGDATIRRFAEREHKVVHWSEFDRGGHFAALQVPELLTGDIRAFFRRVR